MSLEVLFSNHTPIVDATDLYIIADDLIIRKADNRFYRSYVCEKNTKVLARAVLAEYNKYNLDLPENVTVLILKDDHTHLVYDKVTTVEHLVNYLRFASRVICNLKLLEENICLDGIFVNMDRVNAKMWKTNKILLTNTNFREFTKSHFRGDPPAEAQNYDFNPLTTPKYKKYLHKIRYTVPPPVNICTQENFNWMVAYLVELNLQNLVVRIMRAFLLSIESCHIALRCPHLRSVIDIYPEVSGYMIYAMRILYLEEREKFGEGVRAPTVGWTERFLFKLEDVEGLPHYKKFTWDNPYFVEPGFGMSTKQQLWIPAYIKGTRGIYSRTEAMPRFQEYTGGLLDGLSWTDNSNVDGKPVRTVLCGSAIPAIFIRNVLESYIKENYFQEYYPAQTLGRPAVDVEAPGYEKQLFVIEEDAEEVPKADDEAVEETPDMVDADLEPFSKLELAHQHLMNVRKWKDTNAEKDATRAYLNEVANDRARQEHQLLQTVPRINSTSVDNLNSSEQLKSDDKPSKDKEEIDDNIPGDNVPKSDAFPPKPENNLTDSEKMQDKYTDIDLMIETDNFEVFDAIAKKHFNTILSNVGEIYKEHVYMRVIYTENKYKYKIYGLPRPIEIFMVADIPGTISKFHMAPVRAWWDGDNLHMFPTFITAAMTSVCFDMRWVSCAKDLRDIVLKYFQRGFTQILNKEEAKNINTYINHSPKWLTWIMPAGWGGWRARRWSSRATYIDKEEIFNPSICGEGIHYGIKSTTQTINPLEYSIKADHYDAFQMPRCLSRSLLKTKIVNPGKVTVAWASAYQ